MDSDLQSRIEARLAKHKIDSSHQQMQTYQTIPQLPQKASQQIFATNMNQQPSLAVQQLTSHIQDISQDYTQTSRELTQTKSKLLTLERKATNYESELKNKEQTLRRTIAETAGERQALVEALGEARGKVDTLIIDLERKSDIIQKQETRIAKLTEELTSQQQNHIKLQSQHQLQNYEQREFKDQLNVLETKIQIQEAEYCKVVNELELLRNQSLENKVIKQRVLQLEHEYDSVAKKYKAECENNINVRAEFVQLKSEHSLVLERLIRAQEGCERYESVNNKYEELSREYQECNRLKRIATEQLDEIKSKYIVNDKQLIDEKKAIQAISAHIKQMLSIPVAEEFNRQSIEDTLTYQCFSNVLMRVKACMDGSRHLEKENKTLIQNLNEVRRDNQQLQQVNDELQIKTDSYKQSYERITSGFDEQYKELAQVKQTLSQREQVLSKLNCEAGLAINQITQVCGKNIQCPEELNVNNYVLEATQYIIRLQKQSQQLNDELDVFTTRIQNNEQQIQSYTLNQQSQADEIDFLKQKLSAVTQGLSKYEQESKQLRTTLVNTAQFAQLQLTQTNESDRLCSLLRQQQQISNILVNCFLVEQSPAIVRKRNVIRRAVYAILFVVKLKKLSQTTREISGLDRQSIVSATENSPFKFAEQLSLIVQPVLLQSGDLNQGLLKLKLSDQRLIVNKALNNFLSQSVVHCFKTNKLSLQTGPFNLVQRFIENVQKISYNQTTDLSFQNQQLIQQNQQLSGKLDTLQQQLKTNQYTTQKQENEVESLKQSIQQCYVPQQQYDDLQVQHQRIMQQMQQQEQMIQLMVRQKDSHEVDLQAFKNEIQRLQEQLQMADSLVKRANQKFEQQSSLHSKLRDQLQLNEQQLQQRDQELHDLQSATQKMTLDQEVQRGIQDDLRKYIQKLEQEANTRNGIIQELENQLEGEKRVRNVQDAQIMSKLKQNIPPVPRSDIRPQVAEPIIPIQVFQKKGQAQNEIRDLIRQLDESLGGDM